MTPNNIVHLADFQKITDKAAAARSRALAADENDDAAFDAALSATAQQPATSLAGVSAKFEMLTAYLDHLAFGGEVTESGWIEIDALRDSIASALHRLGPRRRAG